MVNLRKPAKVNLVKGQNVCLTKTASKEGESVKYAFIGANWGSLSNGDSVDLDSSLIMFDENKKIVDIVYFSKLRSDDGSVKHSGDDREGDRFGNDGKDNEIISIDFSKIDSRVKYMVSVLNNYTHQRFGLIPNIELRIYTNDSGKKNDIDNVICSYKIDNNIEYDKFQAIVLGHYYKHNGIWKFSADGMGTTERSIKDISKGSALQVLE